MSRPKTWKERQKRIDRKKSFKGRSGLKPVVKMIDIDALSEKCQNFLFETMERNWITRNSRCPCNSGHRFKNCHMEMKEVVNEKSSQEKVSCMSRVDSICH